MRRSLSFAGWLLPILLNAACSGGGDEADPGGGDPGGGKGAATAGQLELLLVDAPSDEVKGIVVTIARVEAHVAGGGGWVTLLGQERTVDLLALQGGAFASLGVSTVPSGRITQIRLVLSEGGTNHVVTRGNKTEPLELPSGVESGIKINAGFDWPPCARGIVTVDFDGKQSLFVHPRAADGGEPGWQLRPVIHLRSVEIDVGGCSGGSPATPDAGAQPGGGNGNGKGNGKGNGGNGNGGNGKGKPGDPPGRATPDSATSGVPRACATVSCPMGAQFCLNGTCHEVTAP